jgi:hypothetical protein
MAHAIQRVVGGPHATIRRFAWVLAFAVSPRVTVFREMLELRYLRRRPLRLDTAKRIAFLSAEPHTAIDAAARATPVALGCRPNDHDVRPTVQARRGPPRPERGASQQRGRFRVLVVRGQAQTSWWRRSQRDSAAIIRLGVAPMHSAARSSSTRAGTLRRGRRKREGQVSSRQRL